MTLRVESLENLASVLEANGIDFEQADGSITTSPEDACGSALRFTEAAPA